MGGSTGLPYTYMHRRASDGAAFYIGKGTGDRAHLHKGRTAHWKNIVARHGLEVVILAHWPTHGEAFEHEKFLIKCYREMGVKLCNITDGGAGVPGRDKGKKLSAEHIAKTAAAKRGHKQSAETVAKRIAKVRGQRRTPEQLEVFRMIAQNRTPEHLAKIAEALRGKSPSAEVRARMSAAGQGRIVPDSVRLKISAGNKGKFVSDETRIKIGDIHRGKIATEATRAKMRTAATARAKRGAAHHLARSVQCVETGMLFETLSAAAAWLVSIGHRGATTSSIRPVLSGDRPHCYGFTWRDFSGI